MTINGGTIKAYGGYITLTYTDFASVKAEDGYNGKVTLQKAFTDGTDVYEAGDYEDTAAFRGKTLRPYISGQQGGYTPEKSSNTLTISPKKKTVKRAKLTKAKSFKITAKNAKGKVTYTALKKAKKAGIKVTKKGKVTIPKNCRKGTYKIKVRAAGNKKFKAKTLYTVITVK